MKRNPLRDQATPHKSQHEDVGTTLTPSSLSSGMTIRAVVLGLILALGVALWTLHASFQLRASHLTVSHLPVAALFPFFLVVFVFNGFLKRFAPKRVFTPSELIIIFFIVFTASCVPAWGFSSYWVAVPSMPFYYANEENRWAELFFDVLPDWLVVSDSGRAIQWFYEGLPIHSSQIPWVEWLIPMGWWGTLLLSLFSVCAAIMVILRKQWIERERLTFPLARVPMLLVEESDEPSLLPKIAGRKLFWLGFSFPLFVICWNIASYWDLVAPIPLGAPYTANITLAESFPAMSFKASFAFLSIGYFTELSILFSVWVFVLLSAIQVGIMSRIGVPRTAEIVLAQHLGGFFVYTLFGLWMARSHLGDVLRKAFGRDEDVDDSGEFMSYRTAVFVIFFGITYIGLFLYAGGMSLKAISVLLTTALLLYVGVTRVVAEAGLIYLDLPYNAHDFTVFSLGSSNLHRADLTMLTLCQTFSRNWRTLGMCSIAHLNKVSEETGTSKRGTFSVVVAALGIAAITSLVYTIYLGYTTNGAGQFVGSFGNSLASYSTLATWIENQTQLTGGEFFSLSLGGAIGWILILLHHRFPWWPLHPIGFAVGQVWALKVVFGSIFLIWLIKALIMKFGGTRLYREAQPFFIGMLVGYVLGVFISYGVDVFWFPNNGHVVETW
jgi:hypothetical protein